MMMSKPQDINNYRFSKTDKLFLDANIWLYVYGPQGGSNDFKTHIYSKALGHAMQAQSQILIDVLVISEYINRFARLEYDIQFPDKSTRPDYKQFRNSPDFIPIASTISATVRKIIKISSRLESNFSTVDIQELLAQFEIGGYDFNDQILTHLCQSHNMLLVTHDADFKGKQVNILTANQRILN